MQPPNPLKLKSNLQSNSSTLEQCHQSNIDLSTKHIEALTNKTDGIPMRKKRSIKSEYTIYGQEINSNSFQMIKRESISIDENQIESVEMLLMTPVTETNTNEIRLTMQSTNTHQSHMRCIKPCKLRRSSAQPLIRSWFGWFRPKKTTAFYSPPLEHPTRGIEFQLHLNENPNAVHNKCTLAEGVSNSNLQNVNPMTLKDELAAYMDEIRARERR